MLTQKGLSYNAVPNMNSYFFTIQLNNSEVGFGKFDEIPIAWEQESFT